MREGRKKKKNSKPKCEAMRGGREAAGKNSLPEPCPRAGGRREAGVETRGMRTLAGRGSEFRSCLSAHRAGSRGTRSEGEEEGAGEVWQIGGAWGSFAFPSDRTPQAPFCRSGLCGRGKCQDASN